MDARPIRTLSANNECAKLLSAPLPLKRAAVSAALFISSFLRICPYKGLTVMDLIRYMCLEPLGSRKKEMTCEKQN
jgi:hypothetical protein